MRTLETFDAVAPMPFPVAVDRQRFETSSRVAENETIQPSVFAASVQQTITTLNPEKVRPRATGSSFSRKERAAPSQVPAAKSHPGLPLMTCRLRSILNVHIAFFCAQRDIAKQMKLGGMSKFLLPAV